MLRRLRSLVPLLLLALLSGNGIAHPEVLRDLRTYPQDCTFYLKPDSAHREILGPGRQEELHKRFQSILFMPWHKDQPTRSKVELLWDFETTRNNPGYGENKREHTAQWVDALHRNALLEDYPNAGFRGITVTHTNLRTLPTHKPRFTSLDDASEGYPFDSFQKSALPANTPVFVSHTSEDKEWVFLESHVASGWVSARDVAQVDGGFAEQWENAQPIAILEDDLPVVDVHGIFLFKASIGNQFPLLGEDHGRFHILVADADSNRHAVIRQAWLPRNRAARKPLKLTRANVARLCNALMGNPYGWGGLYGNRDCSSMVKDLFAPFGLWLPRHSSYQATEGGRFIPLETTNPGEKVHLIRRHAVPFLTLLWAKGHIMVYIGEHRGEPLVFHTMWGVKTRDIFGREDTKVVGHAAVTSLHPGSELNGFSRRSSNLLSRIVGMTILVEAQQP